MRRHHWWLAAGAAGTTALAGLGLTGLPVAATAPFLAEVAWTDQTTHRIPNRLLLIVTAILVTVIGTLGLAGRDGLGLAVAGSVVWVAPLLAVHVVDPRLGLGDVKLAAPVGLQVGWTMAANGMTATTTLGVSAGALTVGCLLGLVAARRQRAATPLAPGLIGGAWLTVSVAVLVT